MGSEMENLRLVNQVGRELSGAEGVRDKTTCGKEYFPLPLISKVQSEAVSCAKGEKKKEVGYNFKTKKEGRRARCRDRQLRRRSSGVLDSLRGPGSSRVESRVRKPA